MNPGRRKTLQSRERGTIMKVISSSTRCTAFSAFLPHRLSAYRRGEYDSEALEKVRSHKGAKETLARLGACAAKLA